MKNAKWIVNRCDQAIASALSSQTGIGSLAAKIAVSRGVHTAEELKTYINTSISAMNDPFLFRGMEVAVETIQKAIREGKTIAVYGDYDVDGITATCLLVRYLRSVGADVLYYIPDRLTEGYGVNCNALDYLHGCGVSLLITVDTGITADAELSYAKNTLGMDIIVTDHHECKETLPDAIAILNPKRPDSGYPFKELAGVGVAFKLVCALHGDGAEMLSQYADLVALGTVADVMPLVGENRAIVNYGIEHLPQTQNVGLSALLFRSGLIGKEKKKISAASISFVLAPKINAAGRFATASVAADLFLTEDLTKADELAALLAQMNTERQQIEANIMAEAIQQLQDFDITKHRGIVLWHENWHHGVIGIVASKLADQYFCPVILISVDDGIGKGSGRSIKGFNLFETLNACESLLSKFGGHELAAGLSLREENLEAFRDYFVSCADASLVPEDCVPYLEADCEVEPYEFTIGAVSELSMFEPYGMGNTQPRFVLRNMQLRSIASIGNDKHLKFTVTRDGVSLDAIWFGMSIFDFPYTDGDVIDVVFSAEINNFRMKMVQLIVRDIRFSESEQILDLEFEKIYREFCNGSALEDKVRSAIRPNREELIAVWRYISKKAKNAVFTENIKTLYRKIRYESRQCLNLGKLRIALDVFDEFSLFHTKIDDDICKIEVLKTAGKADLSESVILRRLLP